VRSPPTSLACSECPPSIAPPQHCYAYMRCPIIDALRSCFAWRSLSNEHNRAANIASAACIGTELLASLLYYRCPCHTEVCVPCAICPYLIGTLWTCVGMRRLFAGHSVINAVITWTSPAFGFSVLFQTTCLQLCVCDITLGPAELIFGSLRGPPLLT